MHKCNKVYQYYQHPGGKYEPCKAFNAIPLKMIEHAVFTKIFQNSMDEEGLKEAIKDSLPDEKHIETLKNQIAQNEGELEKIDKKLDKLVKAVMEGMLRKETIKAIQISFALGLGGKKSIC